VPLPIAKIEQITSRTNFINKIKNKDKIHDIIEEYNNLLKMTKFKLNNLMNKPKLGIKGKNFTKNPTF
jgi:hypothetical protein